eukprot:m.67029 g.67029  ORF g.67029 m.67029 type:complete len:160 (+) comp7439_c0_seq4:130-609(+)
MAQPSTSVKSLCTQRFKDLSVYFPPEITISDLLRVSEPEALEDVERKDRLLMRLFWRIFVEPVRSAVQDPFAKSALLTAGDDVLNLCELLSAVLLKTFQPDKLPTDRLSDVLKTTNKATIKYADLSCNSLLDDDLQHLAAASEAKSALPGHHRQRACIC